MPKCPKCEKEVYFGKCRFTVSSSRKNFLVIVDCSESLKKHISAEKVTSLGKDWHRPCLRCEKCNKVGRPKTACLDKKFRSWAQDHMLRTAENHIVIDHVTQLCLVLKDSDAVEMSHIHSIKMSPWQITTVVIPKLLDFTSMVTSEFNIVIKFHDENFIILMSLDWSACQNL